MKKISIILFVLYVATVNAFAQTNYNVFTYKELLGYKKELQEGFLSYSKTDSKKGTYAVIALYDQRPAKSTLEESFESNWQELVAIPHNVTALPIKSNIEDQEGWKTKMGTAQFNFNGGNSTALLVTLKYGTYDANILLITNSQENLLDVEKLLANLVMQKPVGAIASSSNSIEAYNNSFKVNAIQSKQNSKNLFSNNGISGIWSCYTNDFPKLDMVWKYYVFFADGTYIDQNCYKGYANLNDFKDYDRGTYTINGNIVTLYFSDKTKPHRILKLNGDVKMQSNFNKEVFNKSANVNGKTFESSYYWGVKDEVKNAPANQRALIHFYKNGTFKDEGIITYGNRYYLNLEKAMQGEGQYNISNYTITLKYNDGNIKTASLFTLYNKELGLGNIINFEGFDINKF